MSRSARFKTVALCAVFVGLASLACGGVHASEFIDSAGRSVRLSPPFARVLPAGPPADALLFALAPDALIGLVEPWNNSQRSVVPEVARSLPAIPRLTGKPTDEDVASLRDSHPDLIVDYGDIGGRYSDLADRSQAAIGAPYVLMSGRLVDAPRVVRSLGAAMDRKQRAEEIAAAIDSALAKLKATSSLDASARIPVYYARGADGLRAARAGSSLSEAIDLAGGRNVTPAGPGGFVTLSVEEVVNFKPAIVILADPAAAAADSPLRKALPPKTRFLIDHGLPYGWIERPPSLNRILGALWLGSQLHPNKLAFDAKEMRALTVSLFHSAPPDVVFEELSR